MSDERVVRAPGRVNLMGGQVDYHEGFVVTMAIGAEIRVASRPNPHGNVRCRSLDLGGTVVIPADGGNAPAEVEPAWGRLVAAVLEALAQLGRPTVGFDAVVSSTLTVGGGLSSSAAFEVAVALTACDAAGWSIGPVDLARACQRAEHRATGVQCGIQDQMSSVTARADRALFLDCRTMEVEHLRFPPALRAVIIDSAVARTLEGSPWARRRQESFDAAAAAGVRVLRDATPAMVERLPRGRHPVSEMRRVQEFAAAMRAGDVDAMGALMLSSHASMRDDMEVSIPELDLLVDRLVAHGAHGARLTGGGFGGCVVALVPESRAAAIASAVVADYADATGRRATAQVCTPAAGAQIIG